MCKTETNIECGICLNILAQSTLMFICGHIFCSECVNKHDEVSIKSCKEFECPMCRKPSSFNACIRVTDMKSLCAKCGGQWGETDINQTLITPCGHLFCIDW